ncbi:hypothetical protein [Paraburkholderia sp. C35]|uniref:hypothetical protein n=1 Tax=Paraburkholderia sp. C35 TaxID=2126993 RepID=UPI000D68993A|nr:hypothetical protein [Paraburkholderia sp. C35]
MFKLYDRWASQGASAFDRIQMRVQMAIAIPSLLAFIAVVMISAVMVAQGAGIGSVLLTVLKGGAFVFGWLIVVGGAHVYSLYRWQQQSPIGRTIWS